MKINFGDIINFSFQRTKLVLFNPFSFKKWLALGFAAWISGQLAFGSNLGGGRSPQICPLPSPSLQESFLETSSPSFLLAHQTEPKGSVVFTAASDQIKGLLEQLRSRPAFFPLAIAVVVGILSLIILFIWVGSIFFFVFLENVINNTAHIKQPFKNNRRLGLSYFWWNLIAGAISLVLFLALVGGCFFSLYKSNIFQSESQPTFATVAPLVIPYVLILILLVLLSIAIYWVVQNFVLPIMYKEKIGIIAAWKKTFPLLKQNTKEILVYLLISIAFSIAAAIASFIIRFVITIFVLLTLGILILITKFIPSGLAGPLLAILIPVKIICAFALALVAALLFLPIPVFFRSFNLKFLGEIDQQYDLLTA